MNNEVCFGEIFEQVKRPIDLPDIGEHPLVGVHLHGKGAFLRERKPGLLIKKKRHYLLQEGDIIYNKLFAWRGTYALVGKDLHGFFVSDKYPTYRISRNDVLPEFIEIVFRSPRLARVAESKSVGSAALSKFTLNPSKFLELTCFIPPLQDQKIAIEEMKKLLMEETVVNARLGRLSEIAKRVSPAFIEEKCTGFPMCTLGDLGALTRRSIKVEDHVTYRQITIGMNNKGIRLRGEKIGYNIGVKNQALIEGNDVVFSRIDIRNGAIGFVPESLSGAIVANDFPVFLFQGEVTPRFAEMAFTTPSFRDQCIGRSAGSTNRKKMRRDAFLELTIPLPDLESQNLLVNEANMLVQEIQQVNSASKRIALASSALVGRYADRFLPSLG